MWINKEPFLSHENHAFTTGQQISDARYFLLHPEDQMHFKKIQYETEYVSAVEHDSNPLTGLTGEVLPQ